MAISIFSKLSKLSSSEPRLFRRAGSPSLLTLLSPCGSGDANGNRANGVGAGANNHSGGHDGGGGGDSVGDLDREE